MQQRYSNSSARTRKIVCTCPSRAQFQEGRCSAQPGLTWYLSNSGCMRLLLLVYTVTAWFTGGVTRAARGGFVYGGADMMLTMGRGLQRVQTQREQDGRETLPGTTDSSIGRLHRATFCALKHVRSSHYHAIHLDSRLSTLLRKYVGEVTWPVGRQVAG